MREGSGAVPERGKHSQAAWSHDGRVPYQRVARVQRSRWGHGMRGISMKRKSIKRRKRRQREKVALALSLARSLPNIHTQKRKKALDTGSGCFEHLHTHATTDSSTAVDIVHPYLSLVSFPDSMISFAHYFRPARPCSGCLCAQSASVAYA